MDDLTIPGATGQAEAEPASGCALLEFRSEGGLRAVFSTPAGRRSLPPSEE